MTTPLSPAAQAVIDAFAQFKYGLNACDVPRAVDSGGIAAALRAAADQVVPKCSLATSADYAAGANNERIVIRSQLLDIAAELEAT